MFSVRFRKSPLPCTLGITLQISLNENPLITEPLSIVSADYSVSYFSLTLTCPPLLIPSKIHFQIESPVSPTSTAVKPYFSTPNPSTPFSFPTHLLFLPSGPSYMPTPTHKSHSTTILRRTYTRAVFPLPRPIIHVLSTPFLSFPFLSLLFLASILYFPFRTPESELRTLKSRVLKK